MNSTKGEHMLEVNLPRLKESLLELADIGFNPDDKGIYRSGFSDADMAARRWLMELAEKDGFSSEMDGAGNVWLGLGELNGPAVIIGSHLDSVPAGGMFDGSLGVMTGLEILRVIAEENVSLQCPLRVVATAEEEGRFGGMF